MFRHLVPDESQMRERACGERERESKRETEIERKSERDREEEGWGRERGRET